MEEDFYGNNSLAQFEKNRLRLQKANEGVAANNRRVRMLGFERAMKAQYGPKVEIDPTGVATRNGEVVGNFNEYVKAGGKLQGTPRDTRSQLEIRKQENKKLRENYKEPTFEEMGFQIDQYIIPCDDNLDENSDSQEASRYEEESTLLAAVVLS